MHLVTVTDSQTGLQYSYDADMRMSSADDGLGFYISQLTNLEQKIYEAKYRNIVFQDFIPVDTSAPEWVDSISYVSYDAVAMGKFIAANGKDLPSVTASAKLSSFPVGYAGISYEYSLDELRKSQQLRIPLDATKARMAYRGSQEHVQIVAFFGDSSRGMAGLLNNANVPVDTSTVDWSTATGAQIVNDLNGMFSDVWTDSANVHVPDTLLLPSAEYAKITSMRMDTGTDTTVYEFFLKNNLYTALTGVAPTVKPLLELNTAGAGGQGRRMAYEKNPDNLVMHMPIPFRPLAPQPDGLTLKVPCEYKSSGVEFRYPLSATYKDAKL